MPRYHEKEDRPEPNKDWPYDGITFGDEIETNLTPTISLLWVFGGLLFLIGAVILSVMCYC